MSTKNKNHLEQKAAICAGSCPRWFSLKEPSLWHSRGQCPSPSPSTEAAPGCQNLAWRDVHHWGDSWLHRHGFSPSGARAWALQAPVSVHHLSRPTSAWLSNLPSHCPIRPSRCLQAEDSYAGLETHASLAAHVAGRRPSFFIGAAGGLQAAYRKQATWRNKRPLKLEVSWPGCGLLLYP